MLPKIRLLSDAIVKRIAAGQVVFRPSCVVKELLENALDAGARHVQLIIKKSGKELIQVIDDGEGMTRLDARMAFTRHATSKITQADDLYNLSTFGFRGEALPAIAKVAHVVAITRLKGQQTATRLTLEEAEVQREDEVVAPEGTQIMVKHLFYNFPARRKFLRTDTVEYRHVLETFQRVALARPQVAFTFHQDDKEIYQLPASKLPQRIVHLFGKPYQKQLVPCQEALDNLALKGYVGTPEQARRTRGEQFFFVNRRYIKDIALERAVKRAFTGLVPQEKLSTFFPFFALFMEIPPDKIDVNVDPTKHQIKFEEEHLVYTTVQSIVKKALATHHVIPSLDFDQNVQQVDQLFTPFSPGTSSLAPSPLASPPPAYQPMAAPPAASTTPTQPSTQGFSFQPSSAAEVEEEAYVAQAPPATPTPSPATLWAPEAVQMELAMPTQQGESRSPLHKCELHQRYLIAQVKSGVLLVDHWLAQERILYERNLTHLAQKSGQGQRVLFPQTITLPPHDFTFILEHRIHLEALGFELALQEPDTVQLLGLPLSVVHQRPESLIEQLIEQYKGYAQRDMLPEEEKWARTFARRAHASQPLSLSTQEIEAIIDQLFACQESAFTPDGQRIWTIIPLAQLEQIITAHDFS